MEAGPGLMEHARIILHLEEVEQLRAASSPADAANGACAIISRQMYEQGDRQVQRDWRNHGGGLGQAGQDLPQRPAFLR